ncbi:MAG: CotH kinase family protein [Prevotella sp.]|nr:CotH kinase family protein [Prevotella sp.]
MFSKETVWLRGLVLSGLAFVALAVQAGDVLTSNLPIILIHTDTVVTAQAKVGGTMKVINQAEGLNSETDAPTDYDGRIGIKLRGNSSLSFAQKKYTLETWDQEGNDLNVSLLGMPAESDWVLLAPYNDISLVRDVFAFNLWTEMGHWAGGQNTTVTWTVYHPKKDKLQPQQMDYIHDFVDRVEQSFQQADWKAPDQGYAQLRRTIISQESINAFFDSYAQLLDEAKDRHYAKYNDLFVDKSKQQEQAPGGGWPWWPGGGGNFNPTTFFAAYTVGSYAEEIQTVKAWFQKRLAFLDSHWGYQN